MSDVRRSRAPTANPIPRERQVCSNWRSGRVHVAQQQVFWLCDWILRTVVGVRCASLSPLASTFAHGDSLAFIWAPLVLYGLSVGLALLADGFCGASCPTRCWRRSVWRCSIALIMPLFRLGGGSGSRPLRSRCRPCSRGFLLARRSLPAGRIQARLALRRWPPTRSTWPPWL